MTLFGGWAHFRKIWKESLLGGPGPGLDLGRGGWIRSCFCKPRVRAHLFLIWAHFQKTWKESLLAGPRPGLDLGSAAWNLLPFYFVGGGGININPCTTLPVACVSLSYAILYVCECVFLHVPVLLCILDLCWGNISCCRYVLPAMKVFPKRHMYVCIFACMHVCMCACMHGCL